MTRHVIYTPLDNALDRGPQGRRTGQWLASQLDVNVSQVSRWRRGVNIPMHATQKRIAKTLGVSAASLWPPKGEAKQP
jgi:hypothetical protein